MTSALKAFGLVVVSIAAAAPSLAGEARCAQLGSNCVASEPLQNSDFPTNTNIGSRTHDWSDSVESGEGWRLAALDASGVYVRSVDSTDQPAGGTLKAQRFWGGSAAAVDGWSSAADFCSAVPNAQRACMRVYKRWSPGFPTNTSGASGSACNEVKNLEAGGGTIQGNHATSFNWRLVNDGSSPACDTSVSPGISTADCQGEWCRFEVCVSGNNVCSTSSPVTMTAYFKRVETGTSGSASTGSCANRRFSGGAIAFDKPGDNSWSTCHSGGSGDPSRYTDVAFAMLAAWPTNSGQTIGAAVEIEGSGGATPPPPTPTPSPTAPAAPVLIAP